MKSLLDLLKLEDGLVHNIRRLEELIVLYKERMEVIQEIHVECDDKQRDLDDYQASINEAMAHIVLLKDELDDVRGNLRNYIKTLLEGGASE